MKDNFKRLTARHDFHRLTSRHAHNPNTTATATTARNRNRYYLKNKYFAKKHQALMNWTRSQLITQTWINRFTHIETIKSNAEYAMHNRDTMDADDYNRAMCALFQAITRSVFTKVDKSSGNPTTHQAYVDCMHVLNAQRAQILASLNAYKVSSKKNGDYLRKVKDVEMVKLLNEATANQYHNMDVYQAIACAFYDALNHLQENYEYSLKDIHLEGNTYTFECPTKEYTVIGFDECQKDSTETITLFQRLCREGNRALRAMGHGVASNAKYIYVQDGEYDAPEEGMETLTIYRRFDANNITADIDNRGMVHFSIEEEKAMIEYLESLKFTPTQVERMMKWLRGMSYAQIARTELLKQYKGSALSLEDIERKVKNKKGNISRAFDDMKAKIIDNTKAKYELSDMTPEKLLETIRKAYTEKVVSDIQWSVNIDEEEYLEACLNYSARKHFHKSVNPAKMIDREWYDSTDKRGVNHHIKFSDNWYERLDHITADIG